jgi:hypothetical protein
MSMQRSRRDVAFTLFASAIAAFSPRSADAQGLETTQGSQAATSTSDSPLVASTAILKYTDAATGVSRQLGVPVLNWEAAEGLTSSVLDYSQLEKANVRNVSVDLFDLNANRPSSVNPRFPSSRTLPTAGDYAVLKEVVDPQNGRSIDVLIYRDYAQARKAMTKNASTFSSAALFDPRTGAVAEVVRGTPNPSASMFTPNVV